MNVNECSGSTLAYLGDAVWSLLVRDYLVELGYTKAKDLQTKSVLFVSAKAQAKLVNQLIEENFFTEEELRIYHRGRNYKSDSVPKNTDVQTYRCSTGFEAVLGYWHLLKRQDRIEETWQKAKSETVLK